MYANSGMYSQNVTGLPQQYPQQLPPNAIPGQQIVRNEQYPSASGMAERTIIEQPFEIPQPPMTQIMKRYVPRQISIPQAPLTQLI